MFAIIRADVFCKFRNLREVGISKFTDNTITMTIPDMTDHIIIDVTAGKTK